MPLRSGKMPKFQHASALLRPRRHPVDEFNRSERDGVAKRAPVFVNNVKGQFGRLMRHVRVDQAEITRAEDRRPDHFFRDEVVEEIDWSIGHVHRSGVNWGGQAVYRLRPRAM